MNRSNTCLLHATYDVVLLVALVGLLMYDVLSWVVDSKINCIFCSDQSSSSS